MKNENSDNTAKHTQCSSPFIGVALVVSIETFHKIRYPYI